jgi:hypothetical protein
MEDNGFIVVVIFFVIAIAGIVGTMTLADNVIVLQVPAGNLVISARELPQLIPSQVHVEEFPQQGRWFVGEDGTTRFYSKPIVRIRFLAQDNVSCGLLFFYGHCLGGVIK